MKTVNDVRDTQSESIIVATLLYKPMMLMQVPYLKAQHFADTSNRCIFYCINSLVNEDGIEEIDALTLSRKLNNNAACVKNMDCSIEAVQRRIDLSARLVRNDITEFKEVCKTVIGLAYRREIANMATNISEIAIENDKLSISEINKTINDKFDSIVTKFVMGEEDLRNFGDIAEEIWQKDEEREANTELGLTSKYDSELNSYFTYERGEMVLVAARAKMGKSVFLMNESLYQAQRGVSVLVVDSEMSDRLFCLRALSCLSGVPINDIKRKSYSAEDRKKIIDAKEVLKNIKLFHVYMPESSDLDTVYAYVKMLKRKYNLGLLVFDYLKSPDNVIESSALSNAMGAMCNYLKNKIAGALDIPVLCAAQLARDGMSIADSIKLERYASVVAQWIPKTADKIKEEGVEAGNFMLHIGLNRNGQSHANEDEGIYFTLDGARSRIELAPKQQRDCVITPFTV